MLFCLTILTKFLSYFGKEAAPWTEVIFELFLKQLRTVAALADKREPGYKTLGGKK